MEDGPMSKNAQFSTGYPADGAAGGVRGDLGTFYPPVGFRAHRRQDRNLHASSDCVRQGWIFPGRQLALLMVWRCHAEHSS